jgi:hypothetical protein
LDQKKKEAHPLQPLNQKLVGIEFDLGPYYIDKHKVIELAQVLGDPNLDLIKSRADAVPPYYLMTLISDKDPIGSRPDILFAGLDGEFFAPIKIGDTLSGKGKISDVFEKKGRSGIMIFVVEEFVYNNQKREKVAKLQLSWVRRDQYEPDLDQ